MLLRYSEFGFTERLRTRWAGRQPCFGIGDGIWGRARPLSPSAVAGVFIALLGGIGTGVIILTLEHVVFKYALPKLRKKTKGFWKSQNLMFFSQVTQKFQYLFNFVTFLEFDHLSYLALITTSHKSFKNREVRGKKNTATLNY